MGNKKIKKNNDDTKNAELLIYWNKKIKTAEICLFIIIILLAVFIILEFTGIFNNKIKAYELYAENDNFKCEKALLIKQYNSYLFSTCTLTLKNANISKDDIKEIKLINNDNLDINLSPNKDEVKFNKEVKNLDDLQYQIKYYDNGNLVIENIKMNITYLNEKLEKNKE